MGIRQAPKDKSLLWGSGVEKMMDAFTADTYCIASWVGLETFFSGKLVCLWEAPSKQAIMDFFTKLPVWPVDGIYEAAVVDWAEEKKKRSKGKSKRGKTRST
jgi:hypothetical protein